MTVAAAAPPTEPVDWPVIPRQAWRRGIGIPCETGGHPRVATPMIDDGEYGIISGGWAPN